MIPQYLDVSHSKDVKSLFKDIFKKYGRIDILVNSAGITTPPTPLIKKTDKDFKKVIDVHLMGTFYCMREASSYMIKRNFGRIINISSRAGIFGLYGKCNYSAAKAGIIGLSHTAAKELFHRGITVNVIAPGGIRTPLSSPILNKKIGAKTRLDLVVGEPIDVAHLVSFLSKEESYLINGTVIILDAGGYLWHGMDEKISNIMISI
jgi:3-oxoacyl-[acyl-carrier protein] reductase